MAYPSPAESELVYSSLPLWIVMLPLAGSFIVYRLGFRNTRLRDYGAVAITAAALGLAALLFAMAESSTVELKLRAGFFDPLLHFRVDYFSAAITLLAALIWFLATLFSLTYMKHEGNQNRYYLFYLLSLGSCLGVFMTGDLLSLFLFFEMMTFASYVLVVHAETAEADEAGRNYLYLGVLGGLLLLAAILLLYFYGGGAVLAPRLENLEELGALRYLVALLLMAGFGIKAGAVPLHIWLPKAHPVAPSPASALLSGLMIKTGAYGIIRTVNLLFTPKLAESGSWHTTEQLGLVMIWVGIVTMFSAAFTALFQNNAKRILAYSSISQMGYILMGVGCAAYLGYQGAMGLSGTIYHIANHAFFKASLFMLVGAVYVRTHELDLRKLGGLWRDFPVTAAAFLVAAAGITGVPGLNGYTSKTLLHHAIEDAYLHSGDISLLAAEKIFTLTSALTVCYIIKLTAGLFFGPRPAGLPGLARETASERLVFGLLSLAVIALGAFPLQVMDRLILPAAGGFNLDPYKLNYLAKLNFWAPKDLAAIALVLGLGLLLFFAFKRHLYEVTLPGVLSVENLLYRPLVRAAGYLFSSAFLKLETAVDRSYIYSPYALRAFTAGGNLVETAVEKTLVGSLEPLKGACARLSRLESEGLARLGALLWQGAVALRDGIYELWLKLLYLLRHRSFHFLHRLFYTLIHMDYNPKGIRLFQALNISNLDFNLILVMLFLLFILSLFFFLH